MVKNRSEGMWLLLLFFILQSLWSCQWWI